MRVIWCAAQYCPAGTDTTDCANSPPSPPGPYCQWTNDGECDETTYCPAGTDIVDCCDAGEPTQDPQRWPLRVDAEGRTVVPPERVQPVGVSCTPAVSSAAAPTFDAHIGGGHIARDTGTGAGEEGGSGELVFAVVVVAVGMGLAFYSGLLLKLAVGGCIYTHRSRQRTNMAGIRSCCACRCITAVLPTSEPQEGLTGTKLVEMLRQTTVWISNPLSSPLALGDPSSSSSDPEVLSASSSESLAVDDDDATLCGCGSDDANAVRKRHFRAIYI